VIEDSEATEYEGEENDKEENLTVGAEALSAERQRALVDELTDKEESSPSGRDDNDDDRIIFVGAPLEVSTVQPPNRQLGGFAHEGELLFES
jgi:hypothetical protein